jgi:hypothetical protein
MVCIIEESTTTNIGRAIAYELVKPEIGDSIDYERNEIHHSTNKQEKFKKKPFAYVFR